MLAVATLELRYPVAFFVLMESDDPALQLRRSLQPSSRRSSRVLKGLCRLLVDRAADVPEMVRQAPVIEDADQQERSKQHTQE